MRKVHLFWDNSNVFIGAQSALRKLGRPSSGVRIDFENLYKLAIASRPFGQGYSVGSIPPEVQAVWDRFAWKTGITPELFERGAASGREQAVDQALQVQMLRSLVDEPSPQIAVLLTGDGHGYADGVGFHADLERFHKRGWAIEVLSWDHACASALKAWASSVGCFVRLDDYLDNIVYQEGVTWVKQLDLRKRPIAAVPKAPLSETAA